MVAFGFLPQHFGRWWRSTNDTFVLIYVKYKSLFTYQSVHLPLSLPVVSVLPLGSN